MDVDINLVVKAAKAGGSVVMQYFGQELELEEKLTPSDIRTKADTESETAILAVIKKEFPSHNIFSEETKRIDNGSAFTFVIDPLDGSNNFVLGVPNFTVSIALMQNNETIAAVIYVPVLDQTYWSKKGQGAFLGDKTLHVNKEARIEQATVGYTCGYINSYDYFETISHKLHELHIKRHTFLWSPAYDLCLLASGRMEGFINNGSELYDYAAGKLIVREAGGKMTDFSGAADIDTSNTFIASNGTIIHDQLLSTV